METKTRKRILSLFLVLVMAVSILPICATTVSASSFSPRLTAPSKSGYYGVQNSYNPFAVNTSAGGGNCTWYAWGRAYELLGSRPSLSTGNACTWYPRNESNGTYAYGSTPRLGAIACWSGGSTGAGHVAVVEQINSDGSFVISESSWSASDWYFRTKTLGSNGYYGGSLAFQGFIYIGDFSLSAPIAPNVSLSKNILAVGESAELTWNNCDYASKYWISCWNSEEHIINEEGYNNSKIISFSQPGKYSITVVSMNSIGEAVGNWIDISVYDTKPNQPDVYLPKTNLAVGESVQLSWSKTDNTTFYWVSCWNSEDHVINEEGTDFYKTISFDKPGSYSITVCSYNNYGYTEGNWFKINVYAYPDKPIINSIKTNDDSSVTLNWTSCENATKYSIRFFKVGETEPYVFLNRVTSDTTYTYTLPEGNYTAYVTAENPVVHTNGDMSQSFTVKKGTYTISYNANGGTGAPANQTKTYGTDLTLSSTKPTRSVTITLNPQSGTVSPTSKTVSYTFKNWNTKADGSGTTYASGGTYSANAAATLYAQWTNPAAYTLPTPTRTGYTFKGWNTKQDGTGTTYAAEASFIATSNVTLTALWEINKFTVAYNANGGTGAPANQTKTYGTDLTLSSTKPTRSVTITLNPQSGTVSPTSKTVSYTFNNWKATDGATYAAGAIYKANAGTTLTAQWTNPAAYTLPTPTRTGYTFKGWNTKQDGTGTTYAAEASYSATANVTLYAQWTANTNTAYKVNHYQMNVGGSGYMLKETVSKTGTTASSVTIADLKKTYTGFTYEGGKGATAATATKPSAFDTTTTVLADGTRVINIYYSRNQYVLTLSKGTGISAVTGAGTYYYGQSVSIDATVSTGYTWSKWSDDNTTKTRTYTMPASAATLTANATATSYTISYTLNSGTVATANPTSYNITTADFTLNNPTRTGYTFAGWTGTGLSAATKTVTVAKGSTGNRSYTATWTANGYTVTFNANGGTCSTTSKSVTYDSTYGTLPTPTRSGYTFNGWYTAANGGTKITADTKVTITAAQTLYAQWTANAYTVTFNANGGTTPTASKSVTYDSTYGTLPTPTRSGYTFNGWYTAASGGTKITADTKVTITAAQTLYAQWTEIHVHSYTSAVTTPATCTANGVRTYTCSCGNSYTEVIPATGHTYASAVTTPATCTAGGFTTYTCACGDSYTADEAAALGHDFDEGIAANVTVVEPTATADGSKTVKCSRCSETSVTVLPATGEEPVDPDAPQFVVSGGTARPGKTVQVTVSLAKNPGIVATRLHLTYDPAVLTLTDVTDGGLIGTNTFTPGRDLTTIPFTVLWIDALSPVSYTENGVLVTYTFTVSEDAQPGTTPITLTYDTGSTYDCDLVKVAFAVQNGFVTITDRIAGDANGDGEIDLRDVAVIRRSLAGGWNVTVDESNADVNGDKVVDLLDVAILTRYLVGGWGVTPV